MLDTLGEPLAVALVGLAGGLLLGLAARLGRFCSLGAIEDTLYAGDTRRLRMWGVAIGVAIIGTFVAASLGHIALGTTPYLRFHWNPVASIAGGLVFGYGMALAGNCGFGALARLGGGDLRSFVIVLVMGLAAYATLSGPLAPLRVALFPVAPSETVPGIAHAASAATGLSVVAIALLAGAALLKLLNQPIQRLTGRLGFAHASFVRALLGTLILDTEVAPCLPARTGSSYDSTRLRPNREQRKCCRDFHPPRLSPPEPSYS